MLRSLGTGEVCSEYLGFILKRGREVEVADDILRFLCEDRTRSWDLMELKDLPDPSPVLDAIHVGLVAQRRTFHRRRGWTYYMVNLPETWDDYLAGVSSNRRQRIRRIFRDMKKNGVRYEEATQPDDLDDAWAHLRRLHQKRWTSKGESGCFASERFERFHRAVLRAFLERGELCLSLLRTDDDAIAASYSLRRNGHVYFYQSGIDPDAERLRPGHAIRSYEFKAAIDRGDRCYDFLGGEMDYKTQWATTEMPTAELVVSAPRTTARAHFGRQYVAYHLKQQFKRLAPTWVLNAVRHATS